MNFKYLNNKTILREAKATSTPINNALSMLLKSDYKIGIQIQLVGSGGKNLITTNDGHHFDLDYNVVILKMPKLMKERKLKENVRKALNILFHQFNLHFDASDSTSALQTKNIELSNGFSFSMDYCIVRKDFHGYYHRLKHRKTGEVDKDEYFWNKEPNSVGIISKSKHIKKKGKWNHFREYYLQVKNQNNTLPSFICYTIAINDFYNSLEQKYNH